MVAQTAGDGVVNLRWIQPNYLRWFFAVRTPEAQQGIVLRNPTLHSNEIAVAEAASQNLDFPHRMFPTQNIPSVGDVLKLVPCVAASSRVTIAEASEPGKHLLNIAWRLGLGEKLCVGIFNSVKKQTQKMVEDTCRRRGRGLAVVDNNEPAAIWTCFAPQAPGETCDSETEVVSSECLEVMRKLVRDALRVIVPDFDNLATQQVRYI